LLFEYDTLKVTIMLNEFAWKHCSKKLHGYLCCVASCPLCIMAVSFEASLKWPAGIQILNAIRCLWRTWLARSPDLATQLYFFGATSKEK
jgi:hypothetical protein